MSSLIPFNSDFNQPLTPDAAKGPSSGTASSWTPESAKLHDLDATGVMGALSKLLSHAAISTELRKNSIGPASPKEQDKTDSGDEVGKCIQGLGDRLVLIGGPPSELGGSAFLEVIHGAIMGEAPIADPVVEKKLQAIISTLINAKIPSALRNMARGGLLVAIADMLCGQQTLGAKLDLTAFGATRSDTLLFGESPGRVVLAVRADRVGTILSESLTNGVPAAVIGEVIAEPELTLFTRRLSAKWSLAVLREAAGISAGSADAGADTK